MESGEDAVVLGVDGQGGGVAVEQVEAVADVAQPDTERGALGTEPDTRVTDRHRQVICRSPSVHRYGAATALALDAVLDGVLHQRLHREGGHRHVVGLGRGLDGYRERVAEPGRSAASFAAKPRSDIAIGAMVEHAKFGTGCVIDQEGNKLTINFEDAGEKRVIDSFVKVVG